jgi:hypothetical protein
MPEAPVVTTTATSTAQVTPKAEVEPKKTEAPVQAAPAPATPSPVLEPKKVEAVEPAKPASEPAKEVKAEADAKPKETAPAEVVYDIPIPEGALISKENVEAIKGFAKDAKYSNEQALAVAHYLDQTMIQAKARIEGPLLDACKAHPKYGGEKFAETSENIKRYLERVAPKLIPILDKSGAGNMVEVFEYFGEQAARGVEDTLVSGKQSVTQDNRTTMQKMADEFNANLKKA